MTTPPVERLRPDFGLLKEEYLLVQAWKKTVAYSRAHNWYADTLELDRITVDLRRFLRSIQERLASPAGWRTDPLRIVPAPKTQEWSVRPGAGARRWTPAGKNAAKLRPLAHVSFQDQVLATAVMLCLADRVETLQGDPRSDINAPEFRKATLSYGNRLFCDRSESLLLHRWGSSKLYRSYYADYRTFVGRPEAVVKQIESNERVYVVQSDLKQFYDRVTPDLLRTKISRTATAADDPLFFDFASALLSWCWDDADSETVTAFAAAAGIPDFTSVALPQGLVASGFLANIVLLDFDAALRKALTSEVFEGVVLEDVSRYVDDLRFVVRTENDRPLADLERELSRWLQSILDDACPGMIASPEKTVATTTAGDGRPLIRQSRRMARIQSAISGGFDVAGGLEILASVQGLIRTQQRHVGAEKSAWTSSPVPDVRDATAQRFAAGRFRRTFRSLRPMLDASPSEPPDGEDEERLPPSSASRGASPQSQAELDDDARAFAFELIESWVGDPSNVRLLRIGLDLWPAAETIRDILALLVPYVTRRSRSAARYVALYCLSEIYRAAATETGFVPDPEMAAEGVDIHEYRNVLSQQAVQLLRAGPARLPWYLAQQLLLFLSVTARSPSELSEAQLAGWDDENLATAHYCDLLRFLHGDSAGMNADEYAIYATLARRSYRDVQFAETMIAPALSPARAAAIATRDPDFAAELLIWRPDLSDSLPGEVRADLSVLRGKATSGEPLSELVLGPRAGMLRDDLSLLSFAMAAIGPICDARVQVITPANVILKCEPDDGISTRVTSVDVVAESDLDRISPYAVPDWCPPEERWRFQLGYLLRFILTGAVDHLQQVRRASWREGREIYRAPRSHWFQRLHGSHNALASFGSDWLPVSPWMERFVAALLAWPGTTPPREHSYVRGAADTTKAELSVRHAKVRSDLGVATKMLMLPVAASRTDGEAVIRPLRGCVIQTVYPTAADFIEPTLCSRDARRRHRRHLSAALAAVDKMLDLRATHHPDGDRLDWLILPELAVHPDDVHTHLIPFARAHRSIILAGLTYECVEADEPLVNNALWVIPQRSDAGGLEIVTRRQGKGHLAALEKEFNKESEIVRPFRRAQWIVEYGWSSETAADPLRLAAAICYDATDLCLVSDLKSRSDVFAIPALNQDVATFDQMALALHYHMFQMVIVANNGQYGGSNAYAPYRDQWVKQVFHLHGQPQASVAFFEIPDIRKFLDRRMLDPAAEKARKAQDERRLTFKYPPAGG